MEHKVFRASLCTGTVEAVFGSSGLVLSLQLLLSFCFEDNSQSGRRFVVKA